MNVQQAYYENCFQLAFLRCKAGEFQSFFERLMGYAHVNDFIACAPWGQIGDRKNDGFLPSEKTIFQVYAPRAMTATKAIAKIREDFEGAKKHWSQYFDTWVLVHNADGGLPPDVIDYLLSLNESNPKVTLETWGLTELLHRFRKVSPEDRALWFGEAPSDQTVAQLGFQELQVVLESIATASPPTNLSIKEVPMGKIEANALSESVAALLLTGMRKAPLVERFFAKYHDETFGEIVAQAFRNEYHTLSQTSSSPNTLFTELQAWAGGTQRGTPEHEVAVITVIAYFFERCDIFEEPRSTAS